jgi:hypothetical protein
MACVITLTAYTRLAAKADAEYAGKSRCLIFEHFDLHNFLVAFFCFCLTANNKPVKATRYVVRNRKVRSYAY